MSDLMYEEGPDERDEDFWESVNSAGVTDDDDLTAWLEGTEN